MMIRALKQILWIAAGLATVLVGTVANAQRMVEFLPRHATIGARASGLADAMSGDAHDITGLYWNPASVLFVHSFGMQIDHRQEVATDAIRDAMAIPIFRNRSGAMAVGLSIDHMGYVTRSSNAPKVMEYDVHVAYAQAILPTMSLGARGTLMHGSSESTSLSALTSALGLFYAPTREITYGIYLEGIGSRLHYYFDRQPAVKEEKDALRLQIGAAMRFPKDDEYPTVAIAVTNEKDFEIDELRYKGGIEVWPFDAAGLRFGYVVGPTISMVRYGMGLRFDRVSFDYTFSPKSSERFHHVSLSVGLWGL